MKFNRINNITGWIICAFACTVYILTSEAGGSFWDCGEFVSSCYKLQIPHPPGAPLFVLLGRLFIVLFGNNPDDGCESCKYNECACQWVYYFVFILDNHTFCKKNCAA